MSYDGLGHCCKSNLDVQAQQHRALCFYILFMIRAERFGRHEESLTCAAENNMQIKPALITFGVWCRVPAGTVDTVLSYCHYSLNDQTLADMIPYLKEKNVGIINASALSMGLLTDQASLGLAVNHHTLSQSLVAFKLHVPFQRMLALFCVQNTAHEEHSSFTATLMHRTYLPY